jgi:hypothetical protein
LRVGQAIEESVSGFVVETLDEAVAAIGRIGGLERARVSAPFERRFTVERMTGDYARISSATVAFSVAS